MSNGITSENLLLTLPFVLSSDDDMLALATATANGLVSMTDDTALLLIYARIDELDEGLLDILAHDFKVDWYDPSYMTLAEKRETIKRSWYVHRHRGTKSAVETAISAVYDDTTVREWFEYDGKPFHFLIQIRVDPNDMDPDKWARVLELTKFYKNARSVLDAVEYMADGATAISYATCAVVGMCGSMTVTAYNYGGG